MPTTFAPTSSPTAVPTIHVGSMTAAQGFAITIEGPENGDITMVSAGGDVNGDNLNDLLVGNSRLNSNNGEAFLVRGKKGDISNIDLSGSTVDNVNYITSSAAGKYTASSSLIVPNQSGTGIADMLVTSALNIYSIPGKTDLPSAISLPGSYPVIKAPVTSSTIAIPVLYDAGDLNGDGRADVAVLQSIVSSGNLLARVFVLWEKSGGLTTLQMPPSGSDGFTIDVYNPGSDITNIAMVQGIADVTGDGVSDLGIVVYTSTTSTLCILPGKMGGYTGTMYINGPSAEPSLITVTSTDSASWPSFASGDFDGDGHKDLAVGGIFNYTDYGMASGVVKLFQGGVGAFNTTHHIGKQVSILPDSDPNCNGYSVVTADIDRDGRDDVGFSSPCSNVGGIPYSGAAYFIPSGPDIFSANIQMPVSKMISVIGSPYSVIGQQMVVAGNMTGDSRIAVAITTEYAEDVYVVYFDGFPAADASAEPSHAPTAAPTNAPSVVPSHFPATSPTALTTAHPTVAPTHAPSGVPTHIPTAAPTNAPSKAPTHLPTEHPTLMPTHMLTPTLTPTSSPTAPSYSPSLIPTEASTFQPTESPAVHGDAGHTTDYTWLIVGVTLGVTALLGGGGYAYYYHASAPILPEAMHAAGFDV